MRCGKVSAAGSPAFRRPSQPARMRCGKDPTVLPFLQANLSQPARMRCGKGRLHGRRGVLCGRNPHECAVAKHSFMRPNTFTDCRNPHECAVAKENLMDEQQAGSVATRTNALWQSALPAWRSCMIASQPARMRCGKDISAFRWLLQKKSQPARMRCGKAGRITRWATLWRCRNPHECAVAKLPYRDSVNVQFRRNPHECAVAKQMPSSMRRRSVATRTNALWQRAC